jgi:hypothetical protein
MAIEASKSFVDFFTGIIPWIESHPVTMALITTVTAGTFWLHKYINHKRAEAFFGFYTRLLIQLKYLRKWLNDKDLLETENHKKNNIYALIYTEETQIEVCKVNHELPGEEFEELKELVKELKETITKSDNNVYPKASKKTEWYKSQQVLYEFCEFIENDGMRRNTNIAKTKSSENTEEYKHITMCKKLTDAMDCIKDSIEKAFY